MTSLAEGSTASLLPHPRQVTPTARRVVSDETPTRIARTASHGYPLALRAVLLDVAILSVTIGVHARILFQIGFPLDDRRTVLVGGTLVVGWAIAILARGGYETRYFGTGSEEFKRVLSASTTLLAAVGVVALTFEVPPPLRVVIPSLVAGTAMVLLGRWVLRKWLVGERLAGRFQRPTLLIGERRLNTTLAEAFGGDPAAGFTAIGAVAPPTSTDRASVDVWLEDVMAWIATREVHAVAVAEARSVDDDLLRRLAWRLEGPGIDLMVSPALSDIAGPRISVRPAAGLPLLHLDEPSLTGPKRFLKRTLDLCLTIPAMLVLLPTFLLIGLAIKLDSPGRVFYVSRRVGQGGDVFGCLKFRSMRTGADLARDEVIGVPDDDIVARYREDPRITRVGRLLRRWSLDELPQLLNVVAGNMSLVGPRPVLPEELSLLAEPDHRRHLTRPGLTGLWQVSGRKEVAWPDRMRMDLHYIENWSVALDVVILAKTAKAVVAGRGAY